MRNYEDPRTYIDHYLQQSAEKYVHGLQQAGLQHNAKLDRAMFERALKEAYESYSQHANEVLEHNIGYVLSNYEKEITAVERRALGRRLRAYRRRYLLCLPVVVFGLLACYSGVHPQGFIAGTTVLYAVFSLSFLFIMVVGMVLNRPRR